MLTDSDLFEICTPNVDDDGAIGLLGLTRVTRDATGNTARRPAFTRMVWSVRRPCAAAEPLAADPE